MPVLAIVVVVASIGIMLLGGGRVDEGPAAPGQDIHLPGQGMQAADYLQALAVVEPAGGVVDIYAPLAGRVTRLEVKPGDWVSEGQPLFYVDDQALRALAADLLVTIAEARAAEAGAQRSLALHRTQGDPLAGSRLEVMSAQNDLKDARLRAAEAEAELAGVRADLARYSALAPIDGEILEVNIAPGRLVHGPELDRVKGEAKPVGTPPIRMAQTRMLQLRVAVGEANLKRVDQRKSALILRDKAEPELRAKFVRVEQAGGEPTGGQGNLTTNHSATKLPAEKIGKQAGHPAAYILYELPFAVEGFQPGQNVRIMLPLADDAQPIRQTVR